MAFDKTNLLNDLLVRTGQIALEIADAKEAGTSYEGLEEKAFFLGKAFDIIYSKRVDTWTDSEFAVVEDRLRSYGDLSKVGTYSLNDLDIPFNTLKEAQFVEEDPTVGSHIKGITTTQITNWDAYGGHVGDTNNPHSVTKTQVGLANVDNTSDAAKPISTATQTALDGKANVAHTHTLSEVTDAGGLASLNTVSSTEIGNSAVITAKIADSNVTLSKIQDVTTQVLLGRNTAGTGSVEQLSAAIARAILNVADGADAYNSWTLRTNGGNDKAVGSSNVVNLVQGSNVTIARTGDDITFSVSGVGVTDHGALTGLADDDHSQYHTDSRALTWLGTRTTSDLSEGINLYYTQARFDSAFATKSTTDLSEGVNLYYTQSRFDSAFAAKSTSDLSEGSNLYYTEERVDDRVAALIQPGTGISWVYNDAAGTLTPTVTATTDISGKLDNTTDTLNGVLTVTQDVDVQRHLMVSDTINLGTTDTSSTSAGLHMDYGSSFSTFNNINSGLYLNIGNVSGSSHTREFRVSVDNDLLISAGGTAGQRRVSLSHEGNEKFVTTAVGVEITGRAIMKRTGNAQITLQDIGNTVATAESVIQFIDSANTEIGRVGAIDGDMVIRHTIDNSNVLIRAQKVSSGAQTGVRVVGGSNVYGELQYDSVSKISATSAGVDVTGLIDCDDEVRVNGTKVLGIQQSPIASTTGGATQDTEARNTQDLILAVLRAHGLIAT